MKVQGLCFFVIFLSFNLSHHAFAAKNSKTLEKALKGTWVLNKVTCNGVSQPLEKMDYTLSFEGKTGAYVSVNKDCKQIEPELYTYPTGSTVSIKQGVRQCLPSPCAADMAATECGKETNPVTPTFKVEFQSGKKMILSTSDPKSIDCTGAGQQKPAVFTFTKK